MPFPPTGAADRRFRSLLLWLVAWLGDHLGLSLPSRERSDMRSTSHLLETTAGTMMTETEVPAGLMAGSISACRS
jgi:hypothetical protein